MQEYNSKSIRQEFKDKGIFYTQKELAEYLKNFLPDDVTEIYDPTCGNGGLLSVFSDDVEKYGQDINAEQVEVAKQKLVNFNGIVGDTLKEPAFWGRKFKYIIANPPFSIKWEPRTDERFERLPCLPPQSKADYAFIAHILHYLSDDGMAVVLNFPGILYRGNAEGKIRRWIVEQNYIDTVIEVDGGHFVDTKIATAALILKKHRDTTDIKFIHNDREAVIPVEQIAENDYNLTVSYYLPEEIEREEIDPIALELHARKSFLTRFDKEMEFEKTVSAIKQVLKKYDDVKNRNIDGQLSIFGGQYDS